MASYRSVPPVGPISVLRPSAEFAPATPQALHSGPYRKLEKSLWRLQEVWREQWRGETHFAVRYKTGPFPEHRWRYRGTIVPLPLDISTYPYWASTPMRSRDRRCTFFSHYLAPDASTFLSQS